MNLQSIGLSLRNWVLHTEGSTRSSALIRIGLALLVWIRFAGLFVLTNHYGDYLFYAIALNFFLATTLMFFGLFSRLSSAWVGLILLSTPLITRDYIGPFAHHTYFLSFVTFLCVFLPCGKSYSLDRVIAIRRAKLNGTPLPTENGNLWGLRLISIQVSMVYFWSAFDKTNLGFLLGERMRAIFMRHHFGSIVPDFPGLGTMFLLMGLGTVVMEYLLAIGLHFKATRRWLYIPGMLFHVPLYILFPIFTFSATMWVTYLSYLNADVIHRWIDVLHGYPEQYPVGEEKTQA